MFVYKQLDEIKRKVYKILTELELEVTDINIRREITMLIERVFKLKPTSKKVVATLMKSLLKYVKELKKELINPIDLVVKNYIIKINEVIDQIKYESE